jgi:hypothetical protein
MTKALTAKINFYIVDSEINETLESEELYKFSVDLTALAWLHGNPYAIAEVFDNLKLCLEEPDARYLIIDELEKLDKDIKT